MTTIYLDNEVTGTFTAPSDSQEFTIANKKDFGDKRLDLEGTFSAAGTFDGGTLLLQGYDGAAWNALATLTAAGAVRVGPCSALTYRALMSGGTAPDVTWWVNSELWFEGTEPSLPPPVQRNKWNSLRKGPEVVLSNGDLTATLTAVAAEGLMAAQGLSSGKYYWEVTCDNAYVMIGAAADSWNLDYNNAALFSYYSFDGNLRYGGITFGATYGAGDVVGVALDLDNHKIWFSKNGVWQASGDPAAGTNPAFGTMPPNSGLYYPCAHLQKISAANPNPQVTANFGATVFTYPVPTGFGAGVP